MTPLYLIAEIYPDASKLDRAHELFDELIANTHQEPGCLLYDLVIEEEADHWLMLEKWESVEAWNLHMETAHVKRHQQVSPEVMRAPTVLRFLHPANQAVPR